MKHLFREYINKVAIAECGAKVKDRDWTVKACDIDCPKCKRTSAFRHAAKNPFWGVSLEKKRQNQKLAKEEEVEYPGEDDINFDDLFDQTNEEPS